MITPSDERPPALALVDGEHYPPVVRAALEHLSGRYRFVAALFLGGQEKLRPAAGDALDEAYGLPVVVAGEGRAEAVGAGRDEAGGAGCVEAVGAGRVGGPPGAAGEIGAAATPRPPATPRSPAAADLPDLGPGNEQPAAVMRLVRQTGATVVVDLSDEPVVGYRERFRLASAALFAGARYRGADFEIVPQTPATVPTPCIAVIGTGKRVGKTAVCGRLARDLRAASGAAGGGPPAPLGGRSPARPPATTTS
jgi:hypothetical protein